MTAVIWKVPAAPWEAGHPNWRSAWITHGMSISLRLRQFWVQTTPLPLSKCLLSALSCSPAVLAGTRALWGAPVVPPGSIPASAGTRTFSAAALLHVLTSGIRGDSSDKLCCDSQMLLYSPRTWVRPGARILPSCPQARLQQGGGLRPPTSARVLKSS